MGFVHSQMVTTVHLPKTNELNGVSNNPHFNGVFGKVDISDWHSCMSPKWGIIYFKKVNLPVTVVVEVVGA